MCVCEYCTKSQEEAKVILTPCKCKTATEKLLYS